MKRHEVNDNIISAVYNAAKGNKSLKRVGIFGSYARGEETKDSDIDIVYEDIYTEAYLDDLDDFASKARNYLSKALNKPNLEIDFVTINGVNNPPPNARRRLRWGLVAEASSLLTSLRRVVPTTLSFM